MTSARWNIDQFINDLEPVALDDIHGGKAIVVTDMVNGFVHKGTLASPRVEALVPGIVSLVNTLYLRGSKGFVSIQDTHRKDSLEFQSFPEHCVAGTEESELIPELAGGLFCAAAHVWKKCKKDTLTPAFTTGRNEDEHGFTGLLMGFVEKRSPNNSDYKNPCNISNVIVVGNCTDLCVYQAAMHTKQLYNSLHKDVRVIVPANLVDTYDAPGHNGDFFHKTFLYHMALNGIEVVKEIQ